MFAPGKQDCQFFPDESLASRTVYIPCRQVVTACKTNDCQLGLRFMGHAVHSDPDLILSRKFISDFSEYVADQICFDKEPRGTVNAVNDRLQVSETYGGLNGGQNTERKSK